MRPKTAKDMERYQALLMHWFIEEPTLEYEALSGEEAEQTLQALMTATVDIGLQHPQWSRKLWRTYQNGWIPLYWRYRHICNSSKSFGVI